MRIPTAYLCAYDDFIELHRAAFEDTQAPLRVLTTTHFQSYKYRPLNRGLNLLTYAIGGGRASFFRTRNVFVHLLNIVLVYLLGLQFFGRILTSAGAAILFGLHPLANQAVVGAVMTNTAAHALFLFALLCFLVSLRRKPNSLSWLGVALLSGWLSLFTYEAAIVIFPLMFAYLVIHFAFTREKLIDRRFLIALAVSTLLLLGTYFGIRSRYVPFSSRQAVPGAKSMVKNALMFGGSLVLPLDSVLANQWLGTPLPSEIELSATSKIGWTIIICGLVALAVAGWFLLKSFGWRLLASARPHHLFLIVAIAAALSILLLFTDKASETYMYLPVAFAALLFSSLLEAVAGRGSRGRILYIAVVGFLSVLFGCATWVRNEQVVRCGATAERIVSSLRDARLRNGVWFLWLASVPGEPQSNRYGMYGWRGIDTIGWSGIQPAAQFVNRNELLAATVVTPLFLESNCSGSRDVCFWVHEDGRVDNVGQKLPGK